MIPVAEEFVIELSLEQVLVIQQICLVSAAGIAESGRPAGLGVDVVLVFCAVDAGGRSGSGNGAFLARRWKIVACSLPIILVGDQGSDLVFAMGSVNWSLLCLH